MSKHHNSPIIFHKEIAPRTRKIVFESEELARESVPGQFAHVLCGASFDPLLRRPFSIHDADFKTGKVSLIYEIRGRGTAILAEKCVGETIDLLAPLGKGFEMPESTGQKAVLVAGGIGVAPLCFLTRKLSDVAGIDNITFLIGARTSDMLLCVDYLNLINAKVKTSTDDGTAGFHGYVTDLMAQYLQEIDFSPLVYSCGPMPMLKKTAEITKQHGLKCQISTEALMACGVGACMSCVIKMKTPEDEKYVRCCKEGPVFKADEVIW